MNFTKISSTIGTYPGPLTQDDQNLLLDVGSLAALAYDKGTKLRDHWERVHSTADQPPNAVLNRVTIPEIIEDRSLGLQAFATEYQPTGGRERVLAVIIRGTSDLVDLFTDIQIGQIDFGSNTNGDILDGVRVHKGFHDQYLSILGQFGQKIADRLNTGGTVMFTGHSLGAAVSTLLAMNFASFRNRGKVWNLTFGSPPVGNDTFAERCEKQIDLLYRVKNGRDPVTKLWMFLGYKQAGLEIHLGDDDPFPQLPILTDTPDHDYRRYVSNLVKNGSAPSITPRNVLVDVFRRVVGNIES